MLLALAQWLQNDYSFLRVVNYLTFRAVMANLTALLIGLGLGPYVIRRLTEMKIGQAVRTIGPQTHLVKSGTPTMGACSCCCPSRSRRCSGATGATALSGW